MKKNYFILLLIVLKLTSSCNSDDKSELESANNLSLECDCQDVIFSKGKYKKYDQENNFVEFTGVCTKKNQAKEVLTKRTYKDGWITEEIINIPYNKKLIEVKKVNFQDNKIYSGYEIEISTSELLPYNFVKKYTEYKNGILDTYSYQIEFLEVEQEVELEDGGYEWKYGNELVYTTYNNDYPKSTSGTYDSYYGKDNPCYGTGIIYDNEINKEQKIKSFFECFIKTEKPKKFFYELR